MTRNEDIIKEGEELSGGFGYWGHEIRKTPLKRRYDNAFINALILKGYTPHEVAVYGDWTDGRHIGDAMVGETNPRRLRKIVSKSARSVSSFRLHNEQ